MRSATQAIAYRQLTSFFSSKAAIFNLISLPVLALLMLIFNVDEMIKIPFTNQYTLFVIPGLICIYIIGRSSVLGYHVATDYGSFITLLRSAPVSRLSIVAGFLVGEFVIQFINLSLFIALLLIYVEMFFLPKLVLILAYVLIIAVVFFSFSLLVGFLVKVFNIPANITSWVYMLIYASSGVFYPIQLVPYPFRYALYANPLTYGVDALKYFLTGSHEISLAFGTLMLVVFGLIFISLSVFLLNSKFFIE